MACKAARRILVLAALAACCGAVVWGQARKPAPTSEAAEGPTPTEAPDAQRTQQELSSMLDHYPPTLRGVFQLDPSLLNNPSYLGPYPALADFLKAHPEIGRDPVYYVGSPGNWNRSHADEMWENVLDGLAVFLGFAMAIGLLTWLIRTWIDYRRWSRLAKVQTDVHTKLLDRFAGNEDLLAYIQSSAGSKFLESSPITLDAGPRSMGAPLGRILWSVQAGLVLAAAGIGLRFMSSQVAGDASQPFNAMGVLGIALGIGFVISAIISYIISQRLGLIEPARAERPKDQV